MSAIKTQFSFYSSLDSLVKTHYLHVCVCDSVGLLVIRLKAVVKAKCVVDKLCVLCAGTLP